MGKYRLLALDMDGTLLNNEHRISAENEKWIKQAVDAGVKVCFATGRSIRSMGEYIDQLHYTSPMVTVNGSELWESPVSLFARYELQRNAVEKFHALAVQQDVWFWGYAVDGLYNKDNWDGPDHRWLKFGYYIEQQDVREYIREQIQQEGTFEVTNSHPFNIEINPEGVHKASGLEKVGAMLDISMKEMVAMGDSLNDATMIRKAGLGIAMGNAQQEVKDMADLVTVTNEENGVAKVIQEIILA
ncbi:Cof-type HAD-IIB family hydrolase [Longirhabdus pacifica]|uniref:Cof-type HAD-IIB family hydrolase n=1 Tax=Longirhabdus pacifica TaxID=2305227 RepID=UPI001008E271|nr:Cof-type HAD-IIB family hydrolase [Longirhabdus pacifica]